MVKVLRSLVCGPLESYVAGFAAELAAQGYTRCSAEQHVCFIAHPDRWMVAEHLAAGDLGGAVVGRYLTERRAAGYVNCRSTKAMRPLLDYLGAQGVLLPRVVPVGPVQTLLERYRCYLVGEHGLTTGTARCYLDAVRPFVASRLRGDELDLAGLTAAEVSGFVLATCPGRATGTAKLIVTTLRSLLNFLHVEGLIPVSLAAAVPAVAGWRLAPGSANAPDHHRRSRPRSGRPPPTHLSYADSKRRPSGCANSRKTTGNCAKRSPKPSAKPEEPESLARTHAATRPDDKPQNSSDPADPSGLIAASRTPSTTQTCRSAARSRRRLKIIDGNFMANAAWLALAVMAHNLARAVGRLAGPDLVKATASTLQRRVFTVPGRIVRSGRRRHLRLPASWPWASAVAQALTTIQAIPLRC
jgi:hypothetical protein